jgi:membrane associated rhomboid family serine protease
MGDRDYYTEKKPLLGASNNGLVILFAVNAFIFIIIGFLRLVFAITYDTNELAEIAFQKDILQWFTFPASLHLLASRPWTILVYMFSQYSVWMFVSNMLWLWCFGYILQDLAGNRKLIPLYLYGGVAGAACFIASVNLLPFLHIGLNSSTVLIDGGASIMAIAVATTALAPGYKIFPFIGIPLWVVTILFVAVDYAGVSKSNGGIAIAHLAGALIGFIYINRLQKGYDMGEWMYRLVARIDNFFNPEKKHQKIPQREKVFYSAEREPYQKTINVTQQRVDDLLDKISQKGYDSLTIEERDFLNRASTEEL